VTLGISYRCHHLVSTLSQRNTRL